MRIEHTCAARDIVINAEAVAPRDIVQISIIFTTASSSHYLHYDTSTLAQSLSRRSRACTVADSNTVDKHASLHDARACA
jgi:hypothetical protein